MEDYSELKNNNKNLEIKLRKTGSILNKDIFIVKGIYKIPKNNFESGITVEYLKDLIYKPEERMKYDNSFKELKILEGNNNVYVVKSCMKYQIAMISERETIDKRIDFFIDGTYYNFCSSVDENVKINFFKKN